MDKLRHVVDHWMTSQQQGDIAFTQQELDSLIEQHEAELEALRLRREALVPADPRMMLMLVFSSSDAQLQQLWLQVQQLVSSLHSHLFVWLDLTLQLF